MKHKSFKDMLDHYDITEKEFNYFFDKAEKIYLESDSFKDFTDSYLENLPKDQIVKVTIYGFFLLKFFGEKNERSKQ